MPLPPFLKWCYNRFERNMKERKVCIMKTLRAKRISIRTLMIVAFSAALFGAMTASREAMVMTSGWTNFKTAMTQFFYTGLGGDGTQAIGIVIAVIGIVLAAVSFVLHKLNPQIRMPGWFTCLVVALIGTMLFSGVSPVLNIIQWFRDTVLGWFGFSGFGNFR